MKNKQVVCQNQRGDKAEKARLGLLHLGHRSVVMQVWPTWCVLVQRHVPGLLWLVSRVLPHLDQRWLDQCTSGCRARSWTLPRILSAGLV